MKKSHTMRQWRSRLRQARALGDPRFQRVQIADRVAFARYGVLGLVYGHKPTVDNILDYYSDDWE